MSASNPSTASWPAGVRRLVLWRHAHAVDIAPDDESRSLTHRGRDVARRAGEAVAAFGPFDLALVSTAARSVETWEEAPQTLKSQTAEVRHVGDLYLAEGERIAALAAEHVSKAHEEAARILMIGHNPGFRDVCAAFGGPDVRRLRKGAAYVFDAARTGSPRLAGFVDLA